jgi:hypothetical protein
MEEQRSAPISSSWSPAPASPGRGDARWLLLLILLTGGMRVWQVWHTELTSRDSVGFIQIAWRLGEGDWREVLPATNQHPGYPLAVLGVSAAVRPFYGDDLVGAMQLSAQLASAVASVLLVVPMFYLGRELFNRRVGFWAALLFQCLPHSGRLMADGLSDPLFLLFATGALLFGVRALRTGWPSHFAAAGALGGLAYLTRLEGALIPALTGVVLLAFQASATWRRSWPACLRCGVALSVPALALALPYMAAIKGVSVKPTFKHMTGQAQAKAGRGPAREPRAATVMGAPLPPAVWYYGGDVKPGDRYGWALSALAVCFVRGTYYVLWLPALWGLWWFRGRFRHLPGLWLLLAVWLVLLAGLYRVAQSIGYMGERHEMLLILSATYWAVAALGVLGAWLGDVLARRGWGGLRGQTLTAAVLLALALVPLGKTLATLHADRTGFRQAGRWLAEHAEADAEVVDPYGWASYYAGCVFRPAPARPTIFYVVLEESRNLHEHLYHVVARARALQALGKEVQRFAVPRRKDEAAVVIYRVGG